jgi:Tol biopolymer transport system component
LIGTLQYMAPERLEGREADARSDLFAFGAVLYEMLTGHRAFLGESDSRVIAAVLDSEPPPVRTLQPLTPPALDRLVATCLAKDPDNRWQNAGDLARELRWIAETVGTASKPSNTLAIPLRDTDEPRGKNLVGSNVRSRRLLYVLGGLTLAAVLLIGVVGVFYRTGTGSPAGSPAAYTQLTDFTDSAVAPSLSPDGRMVTFIRDGLPFLSSGQVYVKLLPNGEPVRLTNDKERKFGPVFTPDGSRVAYSRVEFGKNPSWDTWTVPVPGGPPTRLLPNATGLTWLNSGRVLFSEIKGVSLHMGIVTSTESRADRREIYFPAHERAMAHYSWASPDRRWILIVEMDRTGAFSQPCRLVPFDGASAGREVGPQGRCTSAGWSPDGAWMYFSAYVGGTSHIWRQRFPVGPPEQVTFGPTEEEGVTVAPDGRSLITSLGLRQSAIWIHDPSGERPVSSEGFAFSPTLSRDGNRVFYLMRQNSTPPFIELRSVDLDSGKSDSVLPGHSIADYKISPDEKEVAVTTLEGEPQIWVATIDRRAPPRPIVKGGDQVSFGGNGKLIFRKLGGRVNLLFQINRDGSGLEQISPTPILGIRQVSPDGEWVIVAATRASEDETPGNSVVRVRDGASQRICAQCSAHWSPDGKLFYLVSSGPVERTAAISLPPGVVLPRLPIPGIGPANWAKLSGVTLIERALFPGTGDFSTFVFVKQDFRRNLFQIPLR